MTIVLLHGWGCTSESWRPLRSDLENISTVVALDLPGFGNSLPINNFSLDTLVSCITAQLPNKCVLIGWSLGGMLAVQIAARYPQKVSGVITLASNAKFVTGDNYTNAMSTATNNHFNTLFATEPSAALKLFAGLLAQGDMNERALLKKIRGLISSESINPNWNQALVLLSELDNRNAFTALAQPGLHLLGETDALIPASAAPILKALNPLQKIAVLPCTAHAIHWSQPEKVMVLIREFFQENQLLTSELKNNKSIPTSHADFIEKKHIAQSFSRAACTYDSVATLQRQVGQQLLSTLPANNNQDFVIDLGCGTGHFIKHLQKKFSCSQIIGVDLAEGMLSVAQEQNPEPTTWLCSDAEKLPLASDSIDIIFSNLALQWCNNLPILFSELNRVLKPGGSLIFSTLGPNTLHELRSAWREVDDFVHVNHFASNEDLQSHLQEGNFLATQSNRNLIVLTFEKLTDLTRELKALGAHNLNSGRATGLTGRKKLSKFKSSYEGFRRGNLLPATYEVFYFIAKKSSNY